MVKHTSDTTHNEQKSKRHTAQQEEELLISEQTQSVSPASFVNQIPINQMHADQVMSLQRQFGNQFVLNLINTQQSGQTAPIQRGADVNKIQRDPAKEGEDPKEFAAKAEAEHDKQAAPDIKETLYIVTGDIATFMPTFGAATVVPSPANIAGTGAATIAGKTVAVEGDEDSVMVQGVIYMTPVYPIPGTGTLSIQSLMPDHYVEGSTSKGLRLLKKGNMFQAKFQVTTPAMQPMPTGSPVPDPTPEYSGQGHFVTTSKPTDSPEGLDNK